MELAEKLLGIVALVLSGISLLFNIISIAIPTWVKGSEGGISASLGLWQACGDVDGLSVCVSIPVVPDYMKATQAMMILGMLLIIGAVAGGVLKLFVIKDQDRLPKIAGASAVVSGVFMMIGAIVYGAKFEEAVGLGATPVHLDAGFGLAIVAGLLAIVAGVVYFVADNKKQI